MKTRTFKVAWTYLIAAGLVEILMALLLKASDGWTRPWPGLLGLAAGCASVFLLTLALRSLPLGTAYAIWTGIGSLGVGIVGIVAMGDSAAPARIACLAMVAIGMVGLRLLENH